MINLWRLPYEAAFFLRGRPLRAIGLEQMRNLRGKPIASLSIYLDRQGAFRQVLLPIFRFQWIGYLPLKTKTPIAIYQACVRNLTQPTIRSSLSCEGPRPSLGDGRFTVPAGGGR
jgi:hypothetical protein